MESSPVLDAPLPPQRPEPPSAAVEPGKRIAILGVPVDRVDRVQTLAYITAAIGQSRKTEGLAPPARQIVTLNPEILMHARRNTDLRRIITQADLVVPDGAGVMWAARLLGKPLRERVAGTDLLEMVAQQAAGQGWRIFLLGAAPGVADEAADRLKARFPTLHIAGTYPGSPASAHDAACVQRIRASAADLVFVAFGSPAQELWIARTRGQVDAAVAIGIGGALDYMSGRVARAPRWMRRAGLEWLYRLLRQPWRWRRMLALPRFAVAVCAARFRTLVRSPKGQGAHSGHQ